jgi:hypothetical protein
MYLPFTRACRSSGNAQQTADGFDEAEIVANIAAGHGQTELTRRNRAARNGGTGYR